MIGPLRIEEPVAAAPRPSQLLRHAARLAGTLQRALHATQLAERYVRTSDRELAARGLRREDLLQEIRDVVCRDP